MKLTSPWGDAPRTPLRVVLAGVIVVDLITLVHWFHAQHRRPDGVPCTSGMLATLGGTWPLPVFVAAAGVGGAFRFAWRSRALGAGLVALAAHGVLVESLAAIQAMYRHNYFSVAAALSGWLAIVLYHRRDETLCADEVERLAEHGAAAGLAAVYVCAFTSKLLASGASWLSSASLRALLIGQTGLVGTGLRAEVARAIVSSSALATALLVFVAFAQVSALSYPFRMGPRVAVGTALIAFHLGTFALVPVFYFEATVLLLAFSFPWPTLFQRLRRSSP